jgi:hypothetical protein
MNYKYLFVIIILGIFYKNLQIKEGIFNKLQKQKIGSCCGNLSPEDFDPNSKEPPYQIRKCIKDNEYEYHQPCTPIGNTILATSNEPKKGYVYDGEKYVKKNTGVCCNGTDQCIPSVTGGKCRKRGGIGYYIYNDMGKKVNYDPNQDYHESSYQYDYTLTSSSDFIDYLNYLILFVIMIIIIYLFIKVFSEKSSSRSSRSEIINFDYLDPKYG